MSTKMGVIGVMGVVGLMVIMGCGQKAEPGKVRAGNEPEAMDTNGVEPSIAKELEPVPDLTPDVPSADEVRKEEAATIGRLRQLAWDEFKQDASDETREVLELASRNKTKLIGGDVYHAGMIAVQEHYRKKRMALIEREEMAEILVQQRTLERAEMDQPKLEEAARLARKKMEKAQAELKAFQDARAR